MLFLDTEWADVRAFELISIALVSRDEKWSFYAERYQLPDAPTQFARDVVYPRLDRGAAAIPDSAIGGELRTFIETVAAATGEQPTIAYDAFEDRRLFRDAWYGLGSFGPSPPVRWFDLNELNPHYEFGREAYFAADADARRRRHHALVDAFAARAGYLHANRSL